MGTSLFENCTGLTSVTYEDGFTMNYIPDWTFYNTRFTSFTIPASVQAINKGAFSHNTALEAIDFPATVTKLGEEAFRKLETQLLYTTADLDNIVIATGGGTPCHSGNMDFILAHGTAVYLQMPVDALVARAVRSRNPRPLMHGLPEPEMRATIERQLKERESVYLRAPIVIDGLNPVLP